jgi:hypothetical protein
MTHGNTARPARDRSSATQQSTEDARAMCDRGAECRAESPRQLGGGCLLLTFPFIEQKLSAAIPTLGPIAKLLENREATLETLRRLLCHSSSEKTRQVLQRAGMEVDQKQHKPGGDRQSETPAPGHGRNGACAYGGAHQVQVPHASLASGDRCPDCQHGKVYLQNDPHVRLRLKRTRSDRCDGI